MKDIEIIEQFIMDANGGIDSVDSKFIDRALLARLPKWKQDALLLIYNGTEKRAKNTFLNPKNFVTCYLSYSASIQVTGADFTLFEMEPALNLDPRHNGIMFAGDALTGSQFTVLKSPGAYPTAKNAGLIDNSRVYMEPGRDHVKVWGNIGVRQIFLNYIPVDVMNVTVYDTLTKTNRLFDPTIDEYPVSEDVLAVMFQVALPELVRQAGRPADTINDSVSTLEKPANQKSA